MKQHVASTLFQVFFALGISAQTTCPDLEWERLTGGSEWEKATAIEAIPGGGFAVAGFTYTEAAKSDFWVARLDVAGNIIWEKNFGGELQDVANDIAITGDGGFVVAGETKSKGAGSNDVWVIRLNGAGDLLWDKTFGDYGEESANSIICTPDGGFAITGYNKSLGNKNGLVWILKLDPNGNLEWEKAHGGDRGGGIPSDVGNRIVNRPAVAGTASGGQAGGGYAIAAHTRSLGAGDEDVYLIVLGAQGNLVWEKTFGDAKEEKAFDLLAHDDGSFTLAGYTESKGAGSDGAWLLKVDKSGSIIWDKTFGGHAADQANCMAFDHNGNYIIGGYTQSHGPDKSGFWILSVDRQGAQNWEQTFMGYNGSDNIHGITLTPDEGFAVAGEIWSRGAGKSDIWLAKFRGELAKSIEWYVKEKMTPWMEKGEFEKTEAYQERIGGANMQKVKAKYLSEATNYYGANTINIRDAGLSRFDADAETYQVLFPNFREITVAVPIGEAQQFKQHWDQVEFENPSFSLQGESLIISRVEMINSGNRYEFNYPKGAAAETKLEFKQTGKAEGAGLPVYRGSGDPLKGLNVARADDLAVGKYYALIIGIDDYKGSWTPLANAVHDARAVEQLLNSKYRFDHIKTLYNEESTREHIINALLWLVENVKENDNVFIYYSGHGEFEKKLNKGYWVPVDAQTASLSIYISNSDIQTFLGSIASKHTLMVADACFSGDIFRGKTVSVPFEDSEKYFKKVYALKSVQAISSGGIEPVMDGGKDGHSVFAYYFLKALSENTESYLDGSQLFGKIQVPVVNNSDQSPSLQPVKNTGDEGGQFVFIRK